MDVEEERVERRRTEDMLGEHQRNVLWVLGMLIDVLRVYGELWRLKFKRCTSSTALLVSK